MKQTRRWALPITILCLVILALLVTFWSRWNTKEPLDWNSEATAAVQQDTGIRIPGYESLHFPSDTKTVPMVLENPAENTCMLQYEFYLEDETAPIYSSEPLKPGASLEEITLNQTLDSGQYTLNIEVLSLDEENRMLGSAHCPTLLYVG